MIKKILLATDGSETSRHAAEFCLDLKRQLADARVGVVAVEPSIEGAHGLSPSTLSIPNPEAYQAELKAMADKWQQDTMELFKDAGFSVEAESGQGDAAEEISRVAREQGYDLIIMGSHGRSGIRSLFVGSVARKVLYTAHCPVTVVKAPEEEQETT
jgi:nucleotide-binding universal stress UspA family protein